MSGNTRGRPGQSGRPTKILGFEPRAEYSDAHADCPGRSRLSRAGGPGHSTLHIIAAARRALAAALLPDEGHWVLKPQNSQLWYKTVLEWLDKYVK